MIKCPSCSHENVDGTTFCEMCGEELQAAPGVDANPPGATVTNGAIGVGSGGDIKCPACENMNPPENVVCEVCGTELRDVSADDDDLTAATTIASAAAADTAAGDATSGDAGAVTATPDPDVAGGSSIPAAASTPYAADTSSVDTTTVDPTATVPATPITGTPDPDATPAPDSGAPAVALK